MYNLTDVKNYIRATDEDDAVVVACMESARSYIQGAVDGFDTKYASAPTSWQNKADVAMMQLCGCFYEHRGDDSVDIPATVRLMLYQLQLSNNGGE